MAPPCSPRMEWFGVYGLGFRASHGGVLSNSDRPPFFLFVFCTCVRPGGCKVGAGSGSRHLVLVEIGGLGLQALNQLGLFRPEVQGLGLGLARVL